MRSVVVPCRACSMCLASDVRLLTLGPDLRHTLHVLAPTVPPWCAQYACSECAANLCKYRRFCEKTQRAHTLLHELARTAAGLVTVSDIQSVDRAANNLASSLTISHRDDSTVIEIIYDDNKDDILKSEVEHTIEPDNQDTKVWLFDVENVKLESGDENVSEWERELVSSASDSSDVSDDDRPIAFSKKRRGEVKTKEPKAHTKKLLKLREKKPQPTIKATTKKKEPPKKKKLKTPKSAKQPKQRKEDLRSKKFNRTFYEEFATVVPMSHEDALEEIRKRLDSSNYKTSTYKCDKCYRGFWQVASFKNHMIKHDPKLGEFECDVCHLRFESRRSFQHHFGNFHKTKFHCKKCPHVCTNPPLARRHEDWHKGIIYPCKHCEETFTRVSTLHSHIRRLHASEFVCDLCGLSFVGERGILAHKNRMHRQHKLAMKSEGPFCAECNIQFASHEAWKRHLVVSAKHNLKDTANGCEICGDTFPTAEELRVHHRSHARKYPDLYLHKKRNNGIQWPVECEQCKAEIESAQAYKLHFQKHHPDKNRTHYPVWKTSCMCETCGRVFKNQALLRYHQRKHTGERPFKCSLCPKSFLNATYLAAHSRMHTGDMPFKCHLCGKRFNYKGNLERHMNIHSGIKPHKCEYCGKCFTQSSERKSHVDYVHLKKPWPKRDRSQRSRPQYDDVIKNY